MRRGRRTGGGCTSLPTPAPDFTCGDSAFPEGEPERNRPPPGRPKRKDWRWQLMEARSSPRLASRSVACRNPRRVGRAAGLAGRVCLLAAVFRRRADALLPRDPQHCVRPDPIRTVDERPRVGPRRAAAPWPVDRPVPTCPATTGWSRRSRKPTASFDCGLRCSTGASRPGVWGRSRESLHGSAQVAQSTSLGPTGVRMPCSAPTTGGRPGRGSLPEKVGYVLGTVSPNGSWVTTLHDSDVVALPTGGGAAVPVLRAAVARLRWSPDGRRALLQVQSGEASAFGSGHTYLLPLAAGSMLPQLPPGGFKTEADAPAVPGASRSCLMPT